MLTPQQILEKMLESVVSFDGAHNEDSLDRAILRAEANSLFRILRVIEESSGQRFVITASGKYLDLIGQGMARPRYAGESDADYRSRLAFNEAFWNDVTVAGIKQMVKSYYGIDLDGDEYEETRLVELYRQAASFFSDEEEGGITPWSDFGAEWAGANTLPGAFEVHLKCFQEGEERLIKKRQVKEKLMKVRGAGIVVLLYFHISFADAMKPLTGGIDELELIQQESLNNPDIDTDFEVEMTNNEISSIVATAQDKLKGLVSRRIIHFDQQNKCRPDYQQELNQITTPLQMAKFNAGEGVRRAEPFRFRQSRLRNSCWSFYYGTKYEEMDITAASLTLSLAWNKPATFFPTQYKVYYDDGSKQLDGTGLYLNGERVDSPFVVTSSFLSDQEQPAIVLTNASLSGLYYFEIAAIMPNGDELRPLNSAYSTYNAGIHTYYTRPNPMVDATHHYRGDDTYGVEFYSLIEYCDFWWRVSTVENGTIKTASIPWKLTVYKTKEPVTRFWWRVSTIDGQVISAPSKAELLKIMGKSMLPEPARQDLMLVTRWSANANNINLASIAQSDSQVVMLERFNSSYERISKLDIISLKTSRTPARIVMAKLPVCGARQDDPFLNKLESANKGAIVANYIPFDYTNTAVKEEHIRLMNEIVASGYDGVILDGLWLDDAFGSEANAISYVKEIINYFRVIKSKPQFYVVIRGKEHWVTDSDLFHAINGVLSENLFYLGDVEQPSAFTQDKIGYLNVFHTNGKRVFVIDNVVDAGLQILFKQKCAALGYASYVTTQSWD